MISFIIFYHFLFSYTLLYLLDDWMCRRLLGKDLTGMSSQELHLLERQLSEGLICIKERKVYHFNTQTNYLLNDCYIKFCLFITSSDILLVAGAVIIARTGTV